MCSANGGEGHVLFGASVVRGIRDVRRETSDGRVLQHRWGTQCQMWGSGMNLVVKVTCGRIGRPR